MSDNPYANYPAERARLDDDMGEAPSRLSILALLALLLCLPACCVPLLGVGAGPIAAILGVVALLLIGKAQGRLGGRGLATTAVFLGIIATILHGAVLYGMYTLYRGYKDTIVTPTGEFFAALNRGDAAGARAFLSAGASADVADEELLAFAAAVRLEYGEYRATPMDPSTWRDAFVDAYSGKNKPKGGNANSPSPPLPVALEFERGLTVVYTMLEPARLQAGVAAADDLILLLPDGRGLMLRKDGPAKPIAHAIAGSGVHASNLLEETAPPEPLPQAETPVEAPAPPTPPAPPAGEPTPAPPG